MSTLSQLSSLPHFTNDLPDDIRGAIVACATFYRYRAGETICLQNAPAQAIYFVVNGVVQLVRADSGAHVTLSVGDSFGELEVLRGSVHTATAIAVTDADLGIIDRRSLDFLQSKHSALSVALSRHLVEKYHGIPYQPSVQATAHPSPIRCAAAPPPVRARLSVFKPDFNLKRALVILAGLLLFGVGVPAIALMLAATTIQVQGMQIQAPTTSSPRLAATRARPTLVAQWIALTEPTPLPTQSPLPTRAAPTRTLRPPTIIVAAQPSPTLVPVVATATAAPTTLPRVWKMPPWTSVTEAIVAPGQKYYRLNRAIYFDQASAGGRINILVGVLDENGKELADLPVKMEWGSGVEGNTVRKTESKRDPFLLPYDLDIVASHDMASGSSFSPERGERGAYIITVEGLPSDTVSGMGLPLRSHVAFLLVYQRTLK